MGKNLERKKTGRFLDNFERSRSFGLVKEDQFQAPLPTDALYNANLQGSKYPSLTGAYSPILPMTISTVGRDDKKVSFTLLINPETWNEGRTYVYQSIYTRTGWVPQLWGPNQDTVSSTGKTAAFMSPAIGLDDITREMSFGYLNFLSLVSAYKNNGYKFEDFMGVSNITRVIKYVYGVEINYDGNTLIGHFNNITIDESEETPFIFNYNFEFITTTVDGNDDQIRGHYKHLSDSDKIYDNEKKIRMVSDPYIKQTSYPFTVPEPTDERTTIRLWERKTGLPWSEAFNSHQTDGSVQGNLKLRQKLLSQSWNESARTFV